MYRRLEVASTAHLRPKMRSRLHIARLVFLHVTAVTIRIQTFSPCFCFRIHVGIRLALITKETRLDWLKFLLI